MLQNIPKEKIIEIVKQGPTFPAKIAKQLGGGGDTMLIGAILSTMISSGDVKVSSLKVGGSPVYYIPEQESKLEDFLSYLNDKDKKAFRMLKENKVLQDSIQDPLTRVSLRAIKDFAKPFETDFNGRKELFWRFYSIPREDALSLAKNVFKDITNTIATETVTVAVTPVEVVQESREERRPSLVIEPKPIDRVADRFIERPVIVEKPPVQQVLEEPVKEDVVHSEKVHDTQVKHEHHDIHDKDKHTKSVKEPKSSRIKTQKADKLTKQPKTPKPQKVEYNFFELILNHVSSKKLDVISKEKIKKSEYDLVLKNHSTNEYIYCKAKDKPTINEGDLAPALIFAQNKKMPCLFISTGELSKTASILITREFSGLTFEKIVVNNGN